MCVFRFRCQAIPAVAVSLICLLGAPASAQYFGRNKVQYRTFHFEVLKTSHFDVYFYPSEREGIEVAARLAERWNARLEHLLGHTLRGRQPLILYASHPDFEQTNVIDGELTEGTGGVTEPVRRRIVLPMGGPIADTDHVIGHELVHAFQFDMTAAPERGLERSALERLPLWFVEGMAEYLSIGPVDSNTAMWLRDAARKETLPAIKDLDDRQYFPYRWGQAFWAYVGGRWGDEVIGRMLNSAAASDVETACRQVLGVTTSELSIGWHASIREAATPVLSAATPAGRTGRLVVQGKGLGGDLNVGPAISPDGRWIAFVSQRNALSTDLYIADASTGHIVRRLTSTASDPHYSSIQFIFSAGAWDRDSRQIAVATVTSGRAALAIFDAQDGRRTREIPVAGVDEILNPTWAPDGHAIGFTGMARGLTDLFIYDLAEATLRQLTNDGYADLHPAWSPDGRRIAIVTDRYSSDLPTLAFGAYQLALVDVASGAIEPVPLFSGSKHIDPQWSPDGRALFFISDRGGVPNLYRVALDVPGRTITQLTNVGTGVSGITSLSPAMSVSSRTGTIAFTVFEDTKYNIYTIDGAAVAGPPLAYPTDAATLPPGDRKRSDVAVLLGDPLMGLPGTSAESGRYHPALSLTAVGQPSVGVGVSGFGTTFGGGVSLMFGDMLGDHVLATAVQVNSGVGGGMSVKDIGLETAYLNQTRRWNWGVIGGQIPYLIGWDDSGIGIGADGDVIETNRTIVNRQTERSVSGLAAYPLDRARRVEFKAGISHISFDQIVTSTSYSLLTGTVSEDTTHTTPLASSLMLPTASAAYVFDTSTFGATSPVAGARYRFEVSPTFGSISFVTAIADYRRYVMPVSFYTVGVRVMHYGRYGSGSEDPRLYPMDIGYSGLVRGYNEARFDGTECVATLASTCPALDRLTGSRTLVGNLELRFPLFRPFGVSQGMYGPIPVEAAVFTDAGVAWNRGEKPTWLGGSREPVFSTGFALRVNMLGFAVAEFDVVRPLQLPGRGWTFAFSFAPGW